MNYQRKNEILIGIFFLAAMAIYIVGSSLVDHSITASLQGDSLSTTRWALGITMEYMNSAFVIGIACLLLPILKKMNKEIAYIYFSARIIEAILLLIASACVAIFFTLPNGSVTTDLTIFVQFRHFLFQTAMIFLGLGSVFFCSLSYTKKLIPSFLAALGIVGYFCLFLSGLLHIWGLSAMSSLLLIPGSIFEILFPLFLIVKGFLSPRLPT